jgi:ribosomal protein S18 acetylase RimI-like enzyme
MTDAQWQAGAQSHSEGRSAVGFFALDEAVQCGLALGVWLGGEPPAVELNALWIAPQTRGRGAGRALVAAVVDWARQRGATQLVLNVTEASRAARGLYEQLGFQVFDESTVTCGQRRAPASRMQKKI